MLYGILVMLDHAVQYELVILEDFFKDLSPADIKEALLFLRDKDKYYLVITDDFYMTKELAEKKRVFYSEADATAEAVKEWIEGEDG